MKLSPDHRRFLLFEQGIGGGLVNLAIAALLCWLLFRHAERVPVTGSQGMVVDTIASAFMIPFATRLIVTRIVRWQVRRGRIPLLDCDLFCALMPRNILLRAILLGFVCAATIYPIIVVVCISLGANSVSIQHFWLFKLGSLARKARSSRHSSLWLRSHVKTLCSAPCSAPSLFLVQTNSMEPEPLELGSQGIQTPESPLSDQRWLDLVHSTYYSPVELPE